MLDRNEPREIFSEPQIDLQALPRTLKRKENEVKLHDKGGHFVGWKLFFRTNDSRPLPPTLV